jgi:hypothetical protein
VRYLLNLAKQRARRNGLAFDIDETDIIIPEFCPILGIKLERVRGYNRTTSPSLDRIDNSKGYVKGNVVVVSYRANSIKQDATLDELKKVVRFYEGVQVKDEDPQAME